MSVAVTPEVAAPSAMLTTTVLRTSWKFTNDGTVFCGNTKSAVFVLNGDTSLELDFRAMLAAHVRAAARASGLPVRVIRRDCVERCGPLGGVLTALMSTRREAVVFLSCDMPFFTARTIRSPP